MKQYYKHLWLLSLFLCLLSFKRAAGQMYTGVSNTTNGGSASWGVEVSPNQLNVSGNYYAVSLNATDYFFDAIGGGTPHRNNRQHSPCIL